MSQPIGRIAGDDRRVTFANTDRAIALVESQICLAMFGVIAMTSETVFGKNRTNVAIVIQGLGCTGMRTQCQNA